MTSVAGNILSSGFNRGPIANEIAKELEDGKARIDCDLRPKHLESVSIAFVFTDPLISDVPAARRLLSYSWDTGDCTGRPPDVYRFRHHFRLPTPPSKSYTITLNVQVPFTTAAEMPDMRSR
jgi:hypothetical protein